MNEPFFSVIKKIGQGKWSIDVSVGRKGTANVLEMVGGDGKSFFPIQKIFIIRRERVVCCQGSPKKWSRPAESLCIYKGDLQF